ncbi:MAG: acyl carrier protein [Deltaproteobacteria bacterium]|jgi:acyl carrier protein|nr:acyl carrier protein [Deltaproteobacteria bacterium]
MTRAEFLNELKDILQRDDSLEPEMVLKDLEEWDSLSIMALAGFFDQHFSKILHFTDIESFITVEDLMIAAGI